MRKFLAAVIASVIPHAILRKKIRWIIKTGNIQYCIKRYLTKNDPSVFKHNISVVAIVKNEGPYLKEWIEYHRLIGVEKFYIYDNESEDDTKDILAPYVAEGLVEYQFQPGERQQLIAYQHAIEKYRNDTKWLAVIDLDEFIVPVQENSLAEFLDSFPSDVSQIWLGWTMYGSSGHITKPEGLVIENYKHHHAYEDISYENHLDGKCIVNPRDVIYFEHPHAARLVSGKSVDENGRVYSDYNALNSFRTKSISKEKFRINHYYGKSWEEFQKKRNRGFADHPKNAPMRTISSFELHNRNEIYDPIMDKYVELLKQKIG